MEDAAHLVPLPKGSSLVFRENTGELYSTLATHTSEDLQLELTTESGSIPTCCVKVPPPPQASISPFYKGVDWGAWKPLHH